ncbi:MAG: hypothetical protein E7329_10335 [Clostridiales bacterium]|nr:hypothetical protein [Clostridiales bacterium]
MIFYETAGQTGGFLLLLYCGAALGIAYDGFSLIRRHGPGWLGGVLDFIWCALGAALCFGALAVSGESRVRLYAFLGIVLGGGIYAMGLRRVIGSAGRFVKKRVRCRQRQENAKAAANLSSKDREA